MIYLYTKYNHRKFINENKTDRLYKWLKILTQGSKISSLLQESNEYFLKIVVDDNEFQKRQTKNIFKNRLRIIF